MGEIITPRTEAKTHELVVSTQNFKRALRVQGDLGSAEIAIEHQNPDDSWSQIYVDGEAVKLTATNQAIGVFATLGRIRINKPVTTNLVGVWFGA